ncbi:hypothetical protein GQ42DRAFT_166877 [Ramicandelaber brevisporus]|nr:hypothetical protein GQ42DRAFT_166877 [Ramicandelaber brevisporus]
MWRKLDKHEVTQTLIKNILIPRVSGTSGNLQVRSYIVSYLRALDWHVELDEFNATTPYGIVPMANIVATKNPHAARRVILAAHYDSKYFAPPDENKFLGATDSAVPVAIILDAVTALDDALKGQANAVTDLQLVFFDGEEAFKDWTATDSLYGSRNLAELWTNSTVTLPGCNRGSGRSILSQGDGPISCVVDSTTLNGIKRIDLLVLLDLIGASNPFPAISAMQQSTTSLFDRLAELESRLSKLNLLKRPKYKQYFWPGDLSMLGMVDDDHRPFVERGVNALHLITVPFPQVWHTLKDDAKAIDYKIVHDFALITRAFIASYFDLPTDVPIDTLSGQTHDEL